MLHFLSRWCLVVRMPCCRLSFTEWLALMPAWLISWCWGLGCQASWSTQWEWSFWQQWRTWTSRHKCFSMAQLCFWQSAQYFHTSSWESTRQTPYAKNISNHTQLSNDGVKLRLSMPSIGRRHGLSHFATRCSSRSILESCLSINSHSRLISAGSWFW